MLRIYISYAPADKPYLDKLLKWLKPLQERYFLRIWYNTPAPGSGMPYRWDDMIDQLEQAHIYLFLTSYQSLSMAYIDQEEITRAIARYTELGPEFVRIYPVVLAPSHWEKYSRLSGFPVLGGSKPLTEISPEESGYLIIVEKLRQEIEALRRNHLEESYRAGLPVDEFFRPELPPPRAPAFRPIPGWAGAVMLLAIFYVVTSWYLNGCAPRMYYLYSPKALPYQPLPDAYLRDNPVQLPQDVPLRPADDTAGRQVKLPE